MLALFGRAAPRDFVDVVALRRRFDADRLLALAAEKDPGFDRRHFAAALRSVDRLTDEDFTGLGRTPAEATEIRTQALDWAASLDDGQSAFQ